MVKLSHLPAAVRHPPLAPTLRATIGALPDSNPVAKALRRISGGRGSLLAFSSVVQMQSCSSRSRRSVRMALCGRTQPSLGWLVRPDLIFFSI